MTEEAIIKIASNLTIQGNKIRHQKRQKSLALPFIFASFHYVD